MTMVQTWLETVGHADSTLHRYLVVYTLIWWTVWLWWSRLSEVEKKKTDFNMQIQLNDNKVNSTTISFCIHNY